MGQHSGERKAFNGATAPPPVSRALRFLVGAWLVVVVVLHAPSLDGAGAVTMSASVVGLLVFYAALHLLLMWQRTPNAMVAVVVALAPVLAIFTVGGTAMRLGALAFYGASLVVAAVQGDPGCEVLSISGLVLRRRAHVLCLLFSPLDALEAKVWQRLGH
jgi:hypothetical protein